MKYLALIIIFLASFVTHGATLNGVLYDSSTKDIKPSSNVLVGTFSSVSSATILGGTATLTNALTVPNGGSGVATLALNGVLYGNGASAMQALAVNSTGTRKFLSQISSGAPSWADPLGTGTAGVSIRWSSTGSALEDGYWIDGSGFTVPRTNNAITFGSTTNRLAGVNSVLGNFSGQLTSTIASGTPPFVIASTTEVANLNAQKWGGKTLDYLNVGFILGDTVYWNGSGNPTRLLPNQNTNIAFYVQYGTGGTYPDLAVAPFWMQLSAGSNISITRSSLTNFTINATAGGTVTGTGTAGVLTRWASGGTGIEDGYFSEGGGFTVPRTNNAITFGSTTNRLAGVNSVLGNFSGQLTSSIASGTPPFVITSTTEVANLNAQKWGGKTLDYLNVGFILGDTAYWNASGNPTRLLPNQNTNIAFYVQYGTGNAYPDISVAPFWMQVSAGSNISISRSSLTNFAINASTAAGVAVGTGTTGTYPIWSNGSGGLTDGALAASAVTNATLTGNLLANGAVFTNSVGVGTSTPVTEFSVSSTNTTDPRGILSGQYTTDAVGARIHMRKARGTESVPLTVVTTDILGRIRFSGYDSANYIQTASIDVGALGTIAATRVPSYLAFSVGTDASPTVLTERMRILPAGNVLVGTTTSTAGKLEVVSTTQQLQLGYDATKYTYFIVASTGALDIGNTANVVNINGNLKTTLVQLAGTSSSFPSITRNGTTLAVRLADGSADAPISASGLTLSTTLTVPSTITTVGTTGNQTINKMSGRVNIAAAGTTVTVTDSLVTTNSIIMCTIATNDGTATLKNCVPGTGSFVITLTAAVTAETAVSFLVVN